MNTIIKVSLAVLLLVCLFKMPYSYYQLVRYAALLGFGVLAYQANENNRQLEMIIYGALALFFQPFFKLALSRGTWNVVDALVAIGLLINIFLSRTDERFQIH